MQLEAADWSIQATPPVHLQGFTPHDGGTSSDMWRADGRLVIVHVHVMYSQIQLLSRVCPSCNREGETMAGWDCWSLAALTS